MRLARDFGSFLVRTVGHYGYLIGTRGQKCTKELIARSWNNFPTYRTNIEKYANNWLDGNPDNGKSPEEDDRWKVADCMGWFEAFNNGGDIGNPLTTTELVNGDVSTGTVYAYAKQIGMPNGPISTLPKDCPYPIFIGFPGHVAFFHQGKVYQSKGHQAGTVVGSFLASTWDFWYVCPYLDYEGWFEGGADMATICKRGDKDSVTGNKNVSSMQTGLFKLDPVRYNMGTYGIDGSYGPTVAGCVGKFRVDVGVAGSSDIWDTDLNNQLILKLSKLESGGVPQAKYDAVVAELKKANAQIATLNTQLAAEKAKVADLTNQLNVEKSKNATLTTQVSTLTTKLSEAQAEIARLQKELAKALVAVKPLEDELAKIALDIREVIEFAGRF